METQNPQTTAPMQDPVTIEDSPFFVALQYAPDMKDIWEIFGISEERVKELQEPFDREMDRFMKEHPETDDASGVSVSPVTHAVSMCSAKARTIQEAAYLFFRGGFAVGHTIGNRRARNPADELFQILFGAPRG